MGHTTHLDIFGKTVFPRRSSPDRRPIQWLVKEYGVPGRNDLPYNAGLYLRMMGMPLGLTVTVDPLADTVIGLQVKCARCGGHIGHDNRPTSSCSRCGDLGIKLDGALLAVRGDQAMNEETEQALEDWLASLFMGGGLDIVAARLAAPAFAAPVLAFLEATIRLARAQDADAFTTAWPALTRDLLLANKGLAPLVAVLLPGGDPWARLPQAPAR